jgi:hypothetical protein
MSEIKVREELALRNDVTFSQPSRLRYTPSGTTKSLHKAKITASGREVTSMMTQIMPSYLHAMLEVLRPRGPFAR